MKDGNYINILDNSVTFPNLQLHIKALQSPQSFERGDFFMGNVQCKIGDVVRVNGRDYVIAEITYQDFWERGADDDGWMIEFIDSQGAYHYWKQYLDGGKLIMK